MANQIENGGAAFPIMPPTGSDPDQSASGYPYAETGMSMRDWFAGQALPGLVADYNYTAAAEHAYGHADAMIAARNLKAEDRP